MSDEKKPHDAILFVADFTGNCPNVYTEIGLRDLFAAFSLAGIRASEADGPEENATSGFAAEVAYADADAMLRARAREVEP